MFAASFDYHRAASVDQALELLGEHPGAKLLAGGHSLIPMMKLRLAQPPALIDVGRIDELRGIRAGDDTITIGALTTHAEIAASEQLRRHCPLLAEAAAEIGDPQVRARGTIGGNVAHADPASDLPAALSALSAEILVRSARGSRRVAAGEFFTGLLETAIEDGEILTAIEVPTLGPGTGSAYLKFEHPASGYAICGAAAIVGFDADGGCSRLELCFSGVAAVPYRAGGLEEALSGSELDDRAIDAEIDAHVVIDEPLEDLQASGAYRAALARVYGKRAIKRARDRARA